MKENDYIQMTNEQYERNMRNLTAMLQRCPYSDVEVSLRCGFSRSMICNIKHGRIGTAEVWNALSEFFNTRFEFTRKSQFRRKKEPPKKKLQTVGDYVINNLKAYGNSFINKKRVKRSGKEEILEELENYGLKCYMREAKESDGYILELLEMVK